MPDENRDALSTSTMTPGGGRAEDHEKKLAEADIQKMEAALVPSNLPEAGSPPGFAKVADVSFDERIAIQGGGKYEPRYEREDPDNFAFGSDETGIPDVLEEWSDILEEWKAAGLPESNFPGEGMRDDDPEATILKALAKKYIHEQVLLQSYSLDLDKVPVEKELEVEIKLDRIENNAVRTALSKLEEKNPGFIDSIWQDAKEVDLLINQDSGQTMITVRASENKFIAMSIEDFSRMLSVPSVAEGYSQVSLPEVHLDNMKELAEFISTIYKLKSNGGGIGGANLPKFDVRPLRSKLKPRRDDFADSLNRTTKPSRPQEQSTSRDRYTY